MGACEGIQLRAVPDHLGSTGYGQDVACPEVGADDAGVWVHLEVAEGVEDEVATEIRNGEDRGARDARSLAHPHEARATAAMRDIDALPIIFASRGGRRSGDEKGVGAGEQLVRSRGQIRSFGARGCGGTKQARIEARLARLDVLFAVAEAL